MRLKQPSFEGASETPEIALEDASRLDIFGVKLGEKKKRSKAEIQELKEKIGLIYRVFSRNYDTAVVPSPDGKGWACGLDPKAVEALNGFMKGEVSSIDELPAELFKPTQFLYGVDDLAEMSEDEAVGVTRHEVGHANNTDYRLFIKGQKHAKDEGYLPTSYAWIFNALEDPWVNNKEIAGSATVREKMTQLYASRMPEIVEKINTIPPTVQLGMNTNYYWLTGESIPGLKDEKVQQVFKQIRPYLDRYFNADTAQENYEVLTQKIWPAYKALEEKAITEEQLKELARQLSESNLGEEKDKQDGKGSGEGEGKSLMERIKKAFGGKSKNKSEETEEEKEAREEAEGKASEDLKKSVKKELGKQEREADKIDKKLKADGQKTGTIPKDIDLSKLPQEVSDGLKKLAKQLSAKSQKTLEKTARENLDREQAQAIEREGPKHLQAKKDKKSGEYVISYREGDSKEKEIEQIKEKIESFNKEEEGRREAEEVLAQRKEQEQSGEKAQRLREELEKQDMVKNGFDEDEKELYKRFKVLEGSMQQRIANFIKILDRYLPKKETFEHGGEHYTGIKLNKRMVPKRAPLRDYRIFERRESIESKEPRMFVYLLIDNSGSMSGEKMAESLKTAVFWARVLKTFDIPFGIKFFGDNVLGIMDLNDDYDDSKKKIKPKLVQKADASGSHTDIGSPLKKANEEMTVSRRKFVGSFGAVFVISDSGANHGLTGGALQDYIKEMQKNFMVMNFILSQSQAEISAAQALFGEKNVVAPAKFEDLPEEAFKVLRVTLERMLKVYTPQG